MKLLSLYILLFFFAAKLPAQELNCQVEVVTTQLGANAQSIFTSFKRQVYDFMNNYRFTRDKFENNERIECSILINVSADNGDGTYVGQITVQSRRPVFKANYNTPLYNHQDKQFTFAYLENQPFDFNLQGFSSNLTSVLGFYAYVIIAHDYDSFSLLGGTEMWRNAQTIVNNAATSGADGWALSTSTPNNRYSYLDNMISTLFQPLRESMYTYHRKGLDQMYDKPDDGRAQVLAAINNINEVHKNRPASFPVQVFFETKNQEIVNIFQGSSSNEEKNQVIQILGTIDPANSTIYSKILQQ